MMSYEICCGRRDVFLDKDTRSWSATEMTRKRRRALHEIGNDMWYTNLQKVLK